MGRVSSAKGKAGQVKPAQKHKNTFAFTTNKHSYVAQVHAQLPIRGCCAKCVSKLEWRKRMNKYKPLTQPKKCVSCEMKTVLDAYHVICMKCADAKKVCAKCQEANEIVPSTAPKSASEIAKELQEQEKELEVMNLRQRRTYMRLMDKGEEEGAKKILIKAQQNKDDDEFDDDDFDDEEFDDNDDDDEEEETEE